MWDNPGQVARMIDDPNVPDEGETKAPIVSAYDGPSISITQEMKTSYLDYAMSVIVGRALPDVRDGLKPVHRRVLFAMHETNNTHDKPYRKSSRPVAEAMGKYHPHGDGAIYDAMVRMAQEWSLRYMLVDGQGNFGSIDGDSPAAMRYTEARMRKISEDMLADIDKDTVDHQLNFDDTLKEPTVLPARYPNMLVNGASGIAVGMATNIPPHNLTEVLNACINLINDPKLSIDDLIKDISGPDFPTGGTIDGRAGIYEAYKTGRGIIHTRSNTSIEEDEKSGKQSLIINEIPYMVNKARMLEKIAELVKDKKIEGITEIRDESDKDGLRVVIEVRKGDSVEVLENNLFAQTQLEQSFGCNMLALNGGRPEQLTLRRFLTCFIDFREEVVARRTAFELRKARERSHVLCGLAVAVSNVDEIVATIRKSADASEARKQLMERRWPAEEIAGYIRLIDDPTQKMNDDGTYNLSEAQARAILELRLQRLTQIGVKEVTDELKILAGKIKEYLEILSSRERIMGIIAEELMEVKTNFAVPRRTEIIEWSGDMMDEDLIEREEMVVTVTAGGYIKRTALTDFRAQKRGGKGLQGMSTKDEDVVTTLFVANTHTQLLFFSTDGMAYKMKTWRLPLGGRTAKGKAIVNILPIPPGVSVAAVMPVDREEVDWGDLQIVFATTQGDVRRNRLSDFTNVRSNGKIAMKLPEGVELVNARICSEEDDVMLITDSGRAIRFSSTDLRIMNSRASTGVRGIRLSGNDKVVSMSVIRHFRATPEERAAYLKMRRAMAGILDEDSSEDEVVADPNFSQERYDEMASVENLILTIHPRRVWQNIVKP